jgi:RND family efflux transporter MFP subunit
MSRRLGNLALLLSFAALAGCDRGEPKGDAAAPLPRVEVALPVTDQVRDYEEFTGRTAAQESIDIRARVTGYLTEVHFKEGDDVKKGDALFEIDPRPYQAELNRALANLNQADAHLKRLNADFARARPLLARQAISQEEFDKIAGDRDEAEAAVGVARAQRDSARLNLDFTKIAAPIDGRISRQFINRGNLVRADDTVLTNLVTLDPIYATFDVDERTMLRIRRLIREGKIRSAREKGVTQPVELGTSDEDGFPHPGTLNFIENQLDPGTGTLRVRAEFRNEGAFLAPGLFARLRIPIGDKHPALLVAERALGTDQGQRFLFVVGDDNVVDYRPVKVGSVHNGMRAITDGVKPTDKVVVSGLQRVRKGSKVETTLVKMENLAGGNKTALVSNVNEGGGK